MKKRLLKRLLGGLLAFSLVASMIGAGLDDTQSRLSAYAESNICQELLEMMNAAGRNDLIPVWVFRDSVTNEKIADIVYSETGKNPDIYETELFDVFVNSVVMQELGVVDTNSELCSDSRITNVVREHLAGYTASRSDLNSIALNNAIMGSFANSEELFPEEIQEIVREAAFELADDYYISRLCIVNREMVGSNTRFSRNIPNNREVLYVGEYTETLILRATPAEIRRYASLPDVIHVAFYDETLKAVDENINVAVAQTGADVFKSVNFNNGSGFRGQNMRIGVLEHDTRFDPNHPQLQQAFVTYVNNPTVNPQPPIEDFRVSHATFMVIIIAGQLRTIPPQQSFEGVVPEASVFQTNFHSEDDGTNSVTSMLFGISALVTQGVHVINCSFGINATGQNYHAIDWEFDRLIHNTNATIVNSAGNNGLVGGAISSPGKALNVITVGNARTFSNDAFAEPIRPAIDPIVGTAFAVCPSSSFLQVSYLPNKPDIVAPGYFSVNDSSGLSRVTTNGTSNSAPIVSGIAAQSMQRFPSLMNNRRPAVKAFIILNADPGRVHNTNNPLAASNTMLRLRSGAGFVRAENATPNWTFGQFSQTGNTNVGTIIIPAGRRLRAVLVFDKTNNLRYDTVSNTQARRDIMSFELRNAAGTSIVIQSTSPDQNVHIIEHSVAGTYNLRANLLKINTGGALVHYSIMWRII
jgi:subtilisin family serine protease